MTGTRYLPEQIFEAVGDVYNLEPAELKSPTRQKPYEDARRILAKLLYEEAWLSWPRVAAELGLANSSGRLRELASRAPGKELAEVRSRLYKTAGRAS